MSHPIFHTYPWLPADIGGRAGRVMLNWALEKYGDG